MYVEEIRVKRKGKQYCTYLVRESFREGSKVKHRTIANISHLPSGCIEEIKRYLQGKSEERDLSKLKVLESKEYGASKTLLSFARLLQLDAIIHPSKMRWREDILALIVGQLIYPNSFLSLRNMNSETMLWQLCGYRCNVKADVSKRFYSAFNQLLENQPAIQKRLAEKHAECGNAVFCYLTPSDIFKESIDLNCSDSDLDQNFSCEPVMTGLWTNAQGCPWAVDIVSHSLTDYLSFQKSTKKNLKNLKINPIVIISDGQTLTNRRIAEANEQGFKTVTSVTSFQMRDLIAKNALFLDFLSEDEPKEVWNPEDPCMRYLICFNAERKKEDAHRRHETIKKSKNILNKLKTSNKKEGTGHAIQNILAYRTEKFFRLSWNKNEFNFGLDESKVQEEERFDGFYMLRTDIAKDAISNSTIISAYEKLLQVKQSFRLIKISSIAADPFAYQLNDCISLHTFLGMLAYYVQWNMHKKLQASAYIDEKSSQIGWTCREAIERLKAVRCQTIQIEHILLKEVRSILDADQEKIISGLGVSI
jgi:hypothetical protein